MNYVTSDGCRLGVDIGGTFTDIVLVNYDGRMFTKKCLTTHDDYSRAVIDGLKEICLENSIAPSQIEEVVHGTTVVTNACIELTGAKIGLITTKGFRDVLEIGRGRMPVMYDLSWTKPVPLAGRDMRIEVTERIDSKGNILKPLDLAEAKAAIAELVSKGAEAIAVCLINSPKNPIHEQQIATFIQEHAPDMHISISTEIMPMIMEYERSSETCLNAYVMPLVSGYLSRLRHNLKATGTMGPLYIMQSSGGMITPEVSAQRPIEIIECGPAAGVVGAAFLATQQKISNLITFDMGGTTAKASIVENGTYTRSPEYEVGGGINRASRLLKGKGYVLRVPSIDIAEIGAGGGSILWTDLGGALHIGPQSAGSNPGPACYGFGAQKPTLTDANLVLGYLNQNYLCGGELKLKPERAFKTLEAEVAIPMNKDVYEAAYAAHTLANSHMTRIVRAVSSERGRDPRKFWLYAFGGAGAIHAVGMAKELGIKTVVVPPVPGVCSAYGLLCANIERHYARSFSQRWETPILNELNHIFELMEEESVSTVEEWGGHKKAVPKMDRFVDLQYLGQGWRLTIPAPSKKLSVKDLQLLSQSFEEEHLKTYGHRLQDYPITVHSLRLVAKLSAKHPTRTVAETKGHLKNHGSQKIDSRRAYWGPDFGFIDTPALDIDQLGKTPLEGPIIVDTYDTTIVVPPECSITRGDWGNAIIQIGNKEV